MYRTIKILSVRWPLLWLLSYLCFLISCKLQKQMVKKMVDKVAKAIWSYQIHSAAVSYPRPLRASVPSIHSSGILQRERGREGRTMKHSAPQNSSRDPPHTYQVSVEVLVTWNCCPLSSLMERASSPYRNRLRYLIQRSQSGRELRAIKNPPNNCRGRGSDEQI